MDNSTEQLEALGEIRSMMERSSRFISLSGLSGVCAGIFALIGAAAAYYHFKLGISDITYYELAHDGNGDPNVDFYTFLITDAILVLGASLVMGLVMTVRKARKKGLKVWDSTGRRLAINLFIPLAAGGLFCLVLIKNDVVGLVAPATLIFYGLALLNASKYTLHDIRFLGLTQIGLGLIASVFIGYGLLFWALGFGVMHIVYGTVMYVKYEK